MVDWEYFPPDCMDSDSSWCAVCDRQIVPKRIHVPIQPTTPNPPPSPQHDSPRRSKQGTLRQRSGLVQGTGRVRPNGTIKAAPPLKTRIEIDQSPAPLYCSDECRQKDDAYFHARPPVYPDSNNSDTSDDQADDALRTARHYAAPARRSTPNTRSLDFLERTVGLPPLPPPTSETYDEFAPKVHRAAYRPPAYTSGVMMAHRRIDAVLPKALKPGERPPPLVPIPGWTDGSQAWRASTYSFAPPPQTRADVLDPNRAAYQSFVASPHRSAASGVTASSYGTSASGGSPPASPTTSGTPSSLNSELLSSFEDSLARRTSSRLSLFPSPASSVAGSPPSASTSMGVSPPSRKANRAQMAAKGMLLVPDVLLRQQPVRSSDSLVGMAAAAERTGRRHSAGSFPGCSTGPGRRMLSPLSGASTSASSHSSSSDDERDSGSASARTEPEDAEEAAYVRACGDETVRRPNIETRSWSYDNVRTYPVMALPPSKELRRVVGADGVEREVEVEVQPERKRLFNFAPVPKVSVGGGAVGVGAW
ncbi:hypothetical protein C8F04DRAFT_1269251 [Mycena alexandri]|uniref:Uncharacterized protein n=1 Tax=Mycena alexandri TaxID=1745969 RepID=A0AAD6SFZ7_9AGAR|nr:hypothetical protein C8F04DRAFT_1269251 [Mycena alexandri]